MAQQRRLSEKQNFLQKILQKVAQMERKSGFLPWLVRKSCRIEGEGVCNVQWYIGSALSPEL